MGAFIEGAQGTGKIAIHVEAKPCEGGQDTSGRGISAWNGAGRTADLFRSNSRREESECGFFEAEVNEIDLCLDEIWIKFGCAQQVL